MADILERWYAFYILHTSATPQTNKKCGKKRIILKTSMMKSTKNILRRRMDIKSIMYKINLFPDSLRSWYSFELLHGSTIVRTTKNVVKSGCF